MTIRMGCDAPQCLSAKDLRLECNMRGIMITCTCCGDKRFYRNTELIKAKPSNTPTMEEVIDKADDAS